MNDFKIVVPIVRAIKDENGDMIIEGVASTPDVDSHETIFNENCQEGFEIDVNTNAGTDDPVVIEVEHLGEVEPMNHLGALTKANVTNNSELFIRAKLDPKNPKAVYYFDVMSNPDPKLGRPKRLGLSINGTVEEAHWEYNEELGKQIRVFDRVVLKKVGIVRSPSNPNTWVEKLVRSYNWNSSKENIMEENQTTQDEVTTVTTEEVTTEVREEVTEPEVTTEEVVSNNGASEPDAETETRTEETAEETVVEATETPVEEVTETTEVVAEEVETERSEETAETTTETVERTSCYAVNDVLVATANLASAMSTLEWYADYREWSDNGVADVARNILKGMNAQIPALLSLLGTELLAKEATEEMRAADASNTEVHEDLSDDTEIDTEEEETVQKSADVDVDAIVEAVRSKFADELTTLTNKLTDAENANKQLQERIERMEKEPTSTPGGQLLNAEVVTREKTTEDKRKEAIARAKANNDAHELTKLLLNPKYLGK
jgi:hypothetical protein